MACKQNLIFELNLKYRRTSENSSMITTPYSEQVECENVTACIRSYYRFVLCAEVELR